MDPLASSDAKLKSLLDFLSEAESNVEVEVQQTLPLLRSGNTLAQPSHISSPTNLVPEASQTVSSRGIPAVASVNRNRVGSAVPEPDSSTTQSLSNGQKTPVSSTIPQTLRGESVLEGVKSKIATLRQDVEAKSQRIAELESELRQTQAESNEKDAKHSTVLKEQLLAQKNEFEDVIKRQLAFITKIVSDKEALTQRVAELTDQLDALQKSAAQQLEEQAATLTANFKKQRDTWAAAEKARRETWIQERTQAIKEMTIRGLEPELQKIMETSKNDLQRAQEQANEALRLQREEILAECAREKELFKRQLMLEKDQALDAERQRSAERLQEAVARGDDLLRESRARLLQEYAQEKQQALASKDSEIDALREELKAQHLRETQKVAAALEDQRRRHDTFIAQLREQEKMERELWYSNMIKRLQREAAEKVEKIRTKLTEERDEELNLVIARLTRESSQGQQQAVAEYEGKLQEVTRLRRMDLEAAAAKDQRWEAQLAEWQQKCNHLQTRWEQLQSRLNTSQLSLTEKDREMRQLVLQLQQAEDRLTAERDEHARALEQAKADGALAREAVLRKEFDDHMKSLHASIKTQKDTLVQQFETQKSEELEALHARVRVMLEKKDGVISELRAAIMQQERQINELQTFIERQRADVIHELEHD